MAARTPAPSSGSKRAGSNGSSTKGSRITKASLKKVATAKAPTKIAANKAASKSVAATLTAKRASTKKATPQKLTPKKLTPKASATKKSATKKSANNKWVYLFTQGDSSMRDLLGGKGAGVAEMTKAGLPVPPGFTITTAACNAYYSGGESFPTGMWDQVLAGIKDVERLTKKRFGDPANPLLVSVRSGAKFSMPGMMDTVLNLGLNAETLAGLEKLTGDRRFALDAYRRFIQLFGKIVYGIDGSVFEHALDRKKSSTKAKTDADLTPEALASLVS